MKEFRTIFKKGNFYFVGSGSSALYIYLKHSNIFNRQILCPSNICYSIPYTIAFSENYPLFYDVLRNNGNPDIESIRILLNKSNNISVIVLPHMFGNFINNRDEIIKLCLDFNIKIVEDFASSIGIDLSRCKFQNDASIYSFGKNKHIDIGFGGVLATNEDIDINFHESKIENDIKNHREKVEIFDNIFKVILYSDHYEELLPLIKNIDSFIKDAFVYKYDWIKKDKEVLIKKLDKLDVLKENNLKTILKIEDAINFQIEYLRQFQYNKGSNPWRFNILISDKRIRKIIIKEMLLLSLPISTWYPPINSLFNQNVSKNSKLFFEEIINLNISNLKDRDLINFIEVLNRDYNINE